VSAHAADRLSAYLDGELPEADRLAVEAHLRGCPECARHLEELRAVDAAARALEVEAPPGYFDSLPARVGRRLSARRRTPPAWVWAAAAVLALAALTPLVRHTSPVPEAPRTDEMATLAPAPAAIAPPATIAPPAANAEPAAELPAEAARDKAMAEKDAAPKLGRAAREDKDKRRGDRQYAPPPPPPPPPAASAAVQKHAGPWAQSPAPAQGQLAARPQEEQKEGLPERKVQEEPAGKSERERPESTALSDAAEPRTPASGDEVRYRALRARQPASVEAARKLHDEWSAFARAHPESPRADEARVRALDALLAALRGGGDARDRERLREEAKAYLERSDAAQPARVRAILAAAGLPSEP